MSISSKESVLVIEPDVAEAASLRSILAEDFDLTVTASAKEGIDLIRSGSYHVICKGETPDEMDAVTFMQRALSVPDPPCLLLLTSRAAMREEQLEGLSGVMVRPFEPEALLARVRRLGLVAKMRRRVESVRGAIERRKKAD